jgi:xanthosine utilization system XapX-like protein
MESVEERLNKIEERNRKVELDKAWETSLVRILSVGIITYVIAVIALFMIKAPNPFLNALIPTLGFILSTQSLPFIKKLWMKDK